MLKEFDKTRKFTDIKGTQGFTTDDANRLPGTHFILQKLPASIKKEESRYQMTEPGLGPVDRWLSMPTPTMSTASPSAPSLHDPNETDYAPPGMPVFLGQIRGVSARPWNPAESQYPAGPEWLDPNAKLPPWTEGDMGHMGMMQDYPPQMMPINPPQDVMMYPPMGGQEQQHNLPPEQRQQHPSYPHPHPQNPQQQQPHAFVDGYMQQYPLENAESSSGYMV